MQASISPKSRHDPIREPAENAPYASRSFLDSEPLSLPAESIDLRGLVEHALSIEATLTLGQVHSRFRECTVDYFAVLEGETVLGLCARKRIGFILGSRYGFALYSGTPVNQALVPQPLFIKEGTPTRQLLEASFARSGEAFYEDVVLVDSAQKLIGLISAQKLVQLQSRLVSDQFAELYRQHEATRKQNLELFQANSALRQSQALYQALFESHSLGVALLDVNGLLQTCNRRLTALLAFGANDREPRCLLQRLQEHERSRFLAALSPREPKSEGLPHVHEFVLDIPARGPRKFSVTTSWIQETGQISACFDDVTERRALENLMIRQEKQLLLDTMVGGIAHELNNKLTPVLGYAELLRLEKDKRINSYALNISRSLEEASGIIRQLLQLSKPAANSIGLVDLRQVVSESMTMLKFQVRDSGCAVKITAPPLPVPVLADLAQLKQVVINLAINALQAMEGRPASVLEMRIWTTNTEACLSVSDTGVGIPDAIIGRIFDPFFTTKGPDRGTGLGLSICTSIMHLLGGEITVSSQPGAGSVFTLTFPLGAGPSPQPLHPTAHSQSPFKSSTFARILAVDDESVLRNVLQEMLHSCFNCTIDLTQNGAEALDAISRNHYDLIISDIRMPVMSGPELYARLKEINHEGTKRFVFMTGHAGDRDLENQIAEWGVPVIAKPFRLNRLSEVCFPFLVNAKPPVQLDLKDSAQSFPTPDSNPVCE